MQQTVAGVYGATTPPLRLLSGRASDASGSLWAADDTNRLLQLRGASSGASAADPDPVAVQQLNHSQPLGLSVTYATDVAVASNGHLFNLDDGTGNGRLVELSVAGANGTAAAIVSRYTAADLL